MTLKCEGCEAVIDTCDYCGNPIENLVNCTEAGHFCSANCVGESLSTVYDVVEEE